MGLGCRKNKSKLFEGCKCSLAETDKVGGVAFNIGGGVSLLSFISSVFVRVLGVKHYKP
jgi:hypothetical protein